MNTTSVFSEDFYNRPLFLNGERACITQGGSFIIAPKEPKWNRFKRFLTFQQDPHIDRVHEQLKVINDQVRSGSGAVFSSLKNGVHAHGEKKFKCLAMNIVNLRCKLDHVGQMNFFSRIILKLVNIARSILHKPVIELKTYANITFRRPEFFWMANYSMLLNLSRDVNSSFLIDLYNLEKEGLKLTEQDKQTCIFSVESPNEDINDEKFQELEKGIKTHLRLNQTIKDYNPSHISMQSIQVNLSITFDSERSQFLAMLYNPPRANRPISRQFKNYLKRLSNEEKSIRYLIKAKTPEGVILEKELNLILDAALQIPHEGTSSLKLEANVTYEIFSASNELISTFTIRKRN